MPRREELYKEFDDMSSDDTSKTGPEEDTESTSTENTFTEPEEDTSKVKPPVKPAPSFKYKSQDEAEKAADEAAKKMHTATQELADLKKKLAEYEKQPSVISKEEVTPSFSEEEYADMLINPEKYVNAISQKAVSVVLNTIEQNRKYAKMEEQFLTDNPDLVPFQELVAHALLTKFVDGTPEERLTAAAEKVRTQVLGIKTQYRKEYEAEMEEKTKGKLGSKPKAKIKPTEEEEEEIVDTPADYLAQRKKQLGKIMGG